MKIEIYEEMEKLVKEKGLYKYLTEEFEAKYRNLDDETREKIKEFVKEEFVRENDDEPEAIYIYDEYIDELEDSLTQELGQNLEWLLYHIDYNSIIYDNILNGNMTWYIVKVEKDNGIKTSYVVLVEY